MTRHVQHNRVRCGLALGAVLLIAGCQGPALSEGSPRIDAEQGRMVFLRECAACHAADARGGGPETFGLGVYPPDLTQFALRNGGVFPRDEVISVIEGFYRRDHVFDPMPIFAERDMGPTVLVENDGVTTSVSANVLALANYLSSLQQK